MRKLVVRFLMLLFVLGMSTTAWGAGLLSNLDDEQAGYVMDLLTTDPKYNAQLTGLPSTTGSGYVYVTKDENNPRENEYVEGESNAEENGLNISMRGMSEFQVYLYAWAKPAPGYFFTGWSFTPDGTDIHDMEEDGVRERLTRKYDVSTDSNEVANYTIYGTFEPIRMTDYVITGSNSTDNSGECSQSVVIALYGEAEDIDAEDFKDPQVTKKAGTNGDWEVTKWDYDVTNSGKVTVKVKFTAPDDAPAEYAANLVLETKADIRMNVYLNARTTLSSDDDISLYDGKNYVRAIDWSGLATEDLTGYTNPIVKLNSNYSSPVTITKDITLDLNGYSLSKLAVSDNTNVTLAYSAFGGEITDTITVKGKLVLNGGKISAALINNGTLEQNGATITGSVTNNGTMTTTDGVLTATLNSNATLILNGGAFNTTSEVAIMVNSGSATIRKGTISGADYGLQVGAKGTATVEKLAIIDGGTKALNCISGGTLTVNCGKFADPNKLNDGTIDFVSAYFQANESELSIVSGKAIWRNTSGAEFRDGYKFFSGDWNDAKTAGVSVCHIGSTSYATLEDALAFANTTNEHLTIVMDNDYTLPAGYYTLPENAILLIPRNDTQDSETEVVNRMYNLGNDLTDDAIKPSMHRKLTFESGVNMDVHGTIEVSGSQYSYGGVYTGAACGTHGLLQMNKGSHMTLQDRSVLRAWGFITGDIASADIQNHVPMGEIDARRGSTVHELFQMGDWGSAMNAGMGLILGTDLFPLNTYFIQNIEVPVKYHPGAILSTATTVREEGLGIQVMMSADDIKIIGVSSGEPAMFSMDEMADAENTWVRKWYDASTDQQVYDINSGAHVGQLIIPLVSSPLFPMVPGLLGVDVPKEMVPTEVVLNSSQYNLPLTNNFKLHLLSGELDFTQNTELLPGCEVEIDKEATVYISKNPGFNSGDLYVFDWRDWDANAEGAYARRVSYTPLFNGQPTTRVVDDREGIGSAKINVHGTFETRDGFVFTSANGGNIFSSVEDAGTFIFTTQLTGEGEYDPDYAGDPEDYTVNVAQKSGNITCKPVWLKNEAEDDYVHAGALAAAGYSYCYLDIEGTGAKWTRLEQRDCFTYDDANDIYYIKPQEYVAVVVTNTPYYDDDKYRWIIKGNEGHTYSDAAGAGRLFILLTDELGNSCQWWEVEQKKNYYHCIHPENDTYYWWNPNLWEEKDENDDPTGNHIGGWDEVRFTITWKDKKWDVENTPDTILQTYQVPYGTQAEWLSTNPARPASVDYTYDFTGWSPALDKVTSDVTYTATYEAKQIKYTVTFVQDGGMEIERHLLARNEMPVCENVPTRTGYILQWEPALAAVTHDTTYVATWLPEPPTEFAIRFVDYDGKTELQSDSVAVGTMPTRPAIVDGKPQKEDESFGGKPATAEYTYVFDHWSPAVTEVTQAMTYVAVYREVAVLYSVRFEDEDGNEIETNAYAYGETPVCSSIPTKTNTAQYTYSFAWTPQIQTVTGDATYRAVFTPTTNKYTVSVKSNPSGACAISGAGIYDYNTSDTAVTITITPNSGYTFTGWSDGQGGTNTTRQMAITDTIELVANFTVADPDWTITWKSEDGENTLATVGQKTNTATIFTGATPTKAGNDQYSYVFDGWTTAPNNGGTFYKNNMTPKATGNATYYAHFDSVVNQYTVYWKNEAGTANIEMDIDQPYGAEVAYNSATPTKSATVGATYVFDGWSTSVGGDVVSLPATVKGEAIYYAHFAAVARTYTVTWLNDEGGMIDQTTVNYGDDPTHANPTKEGYTFTGWTPALEPVTGEGAIYQAVFTPIVANLEIGVGESEDLDHADVERTNLVITSNGVDASGQLLGAENLSITGEAIFRLEQDFDAETWYAVAVPWTVALSGIRDNDGNAFASGAVYVIEFDASAYASADRESGRRDYWQFLDVTGHDMQPGKLYMVYLAASTTALEFHKKAGASLWTTSTSVAPASGNIASQSNWNAIANPALYYANMTTGAADGDVLKYNGNDAYVVSSSTNMVVGQPIFAQVSTASTVAAEPVGGGAGMPAYRRAPKAGEANSRFVVELTHNGNLADRLIVQTAEEKANEYVIGKDLAKMGVSTKVAQMWMERYNTKLCKNTVEMNGEAVNYPLAISAPVAGEYIISNANVNANAGYALYLTQNGVVIANLSEGDYTLYLNGGTTHEYGLRIGARAPQTATGMDEAVVNAQGDIKKVLIDNKVYIIRGNNVYTVDGQMVK